MVLSARAATKDVARHRRRRTCTSPRSSSTLPILLVGFSEQGEKKDQRET